MYKPSRVSDPDTSRALEGNGVAFFSRMARAPGGSLDRDSTGVRMASGVPFPIFNWVLQTSSSDAEAANHIATTVRHFRSLGMPF